MFGAFTALLAGLIAITQNDIKKVLAYSTVSQLDICCCTCCGAYDSAIFHLTMHAFFKALLFLGAGSVITPWVGEQNMRKDGWLTKSIAGDILDIPDLQHWPSPVFRHLPDSFRKTRYLLMRMVIHKFLFSILSVTSV